MNCAPFARGKHMKNLEREIKELKLLINVHPRIRELQNSGVTFIKPNAVVIDGGTELEIGEGTTIGENVHFSGKIRLGKNCRVYSNATLTNVWAGDDCQMGNNVFIQNAELNTNVQLRNNAYVRGSDEENKPCKLESQVIIDASAVIEASFIGWGTRVFPFSYISNSHVGHCGAIGPHATVRDSNLFSFVCVGASAEIKRSIIYYYVNAKHFCYIGDGEIGEGSNIGAGAVFCNYDGKNKNRTILGKYVFVGSGSMLVAPLTIGDEAFIAAGSVITRDVTKHELVIARGQRHFHSKPIPVTDPDTLITHPKYDQDEGDKRLPGRSFYDIRTKSWNFKKPAKN